MPGGRCRSCAFRNILFPDHGNNIPFTVENYPYIDGFGRSTATFVRTLDLQTTGKRFYEGPVAFNFPPLGTGTADHYESYDEARGIYTIQMQVRNPYFGFLFGYRGEFTCELPAVVGDAVPVHLKPVREENRE